MLSAKIKCLAGMLVLVASSAAQSARESVPTEPGMYVEAANGFTKIIGQIAEFRRSGSKLVSDATLKIKSQKENIQLLGAHAQNTVSVRPVFYFIPARGEADAGVNAGDLILVHLEEKTERRQFEIAARGSWRSSSGISLTHQIQLFRSEVKAGVYKMEPATTLKQGEYALFLARGQGMAPYVYDFSVQENVVSSATSKPAEPKTILTTPIQHAAESSQHIGEGWIGLATELKRTVRHDGVPLSGVCEGGPAEQAGIQTGDTILSIANQYLYTVDELSAAVRQLEPGSKVPVRYQRRAMIVDTYVIVGRQSSAPLAQYPM